MHADRRPALALSLAMTAIVGSTDAMAYVCSDFYPGIRTFPVGDEPVSITSGDFDGDGDVDLAAVGFVQVSVLVANGDATFQAPAAYPTVGAQVVVSGRFDGDGDLDLVVGTAGSPAGEIVFLPGDGSGTFGAAVATPGVRVPSAMDVADLDGNGTLDLVVTERLGSAPGGDSVAVMLGNGDGTFASAMAYAVSDDPWGVWLGDLDGDGILDMAVAARTGRDVSVWLGAGGPIFTRAGSYPLAAEASGVDAGDVDGDGAIDLVVAIRSTRCAVLIGNGDGTFRAPSDVASAGGLTVRVTDLNADGITDIIQSGTELGLSVILGTGGGSFQPAVAYPNLGGSGCLSVVAEDLDGNGTLDVASGASRDVGVLLGQGDGLFPSIVGEPSMGDPISLALADLDGDGDRDVVAANDGMDDVSVLLGAGDGDLAPATAYPVGDSPRSLAVGDLDENGSSDVVVANRFSGDVSVLINAGDGTFAAAGTYGPLAEPSVLLGDADRDGHLDIVASHRTAGSIRVFLGNGDGTFQAPIASSAGGTPWTMAAGDLDNDGIFDLAVTKCCSSGLSVLRGVGNGTFLPIGSYAPSAGFDAVALGDMNEDGNLDVLAGGTTMLFLGNGDGTLQVPLTDADWGAPKGLAVADFDGDGHLDFAVAHIGANRVIVVRGHGDGTFDPVLAYQAGKDPYGVAAGDMDGDGLVDLVVANTGSDIITVLPKVGRKIVPATLPPAYVGQPYAQTMATLGGAAPFAYALTAGMLPPGFSFTPAGVFSGTPLVVGRYGFRLRSTDAYGCMTETDYALDVLCPPISLWPPAVPDGNLGDWYSQTIIAIGGTAPHSFVVSSGSLPPGISLSAGGVLSGTPSLMGRFGFTVTATDAAGCVGNVAYTQDIDAPLTDFVAGQGLAAANGNRVRAFDALTAPVADFYAYGAGSWGASVASGDLDGDAYGEIVTGPGPGPVLGPQVRGFRRDGTAMGKVTFYAYGTLKFGVEPGAGLIDADAYHEILTGAGAGAVFGPHARAFDVDGGAVSAIAKVNFFAYGTLKYGANVEGGDVDGDGFGEILTGPGPGVMFGPQVRGFDYDGAALRAMGKVNFLAPYAPAQYGVNVAAGDADEDGFAEMVTAPGPGAMHACRILGFDFDAAVVSPLPGCDVQAFPSLYGGRVGLGDVDDDGAAEVLVGPGPDGAALAEARAYAYVGSTLVAFPGTPFTAFPGSYGSNVAGGRLGF